MGSFDLTISACTDESQISIKILDRGIGLDFERINKLAKNSNFNQSEPIESILFEIGASTADSLTMTSGRGVGLSAIRNAARSLGGDTFIRAREGGGTEFEIVLPPSKECQISKNQIAS